MAVLCHPDRKCPECDATRTARAAAEEITPDVTALMNALENEMDYVMDQPLNGDRMALTVRWREAIEKWLRSRSSNEKPPQDTEHTKYIACSPEIVALLSDAETAEVTSPVTVKITRGKGQLVEMVFTRHTCSSNEKPKVKRSDVIKTFGDLIGELGGAEYIGYQDIDPREYDISYQIPASAIEVIDGKED